MLLRYRIWVGILLSILLVVFIPQNRVYAVNTDSDLNDAIAAATGGEIITLTGNIELDTAFNGDNAFDDITVDLTIDGAGFKITRDPNGDEFRFFNITDTGSLTLQNITLENGYIYADNGGAIYSEGDLTIVNSSFINNEADGWVFDEKNGGAIYIVDGALEVVDSVFRDNTSADSGGAIFTFDLLNGNSILNSTFEGNSSDFGGGAIHNRGFNLTVEGSTFVDNTDNQGGGGAIQFRGDNFSLYDSTFDGNSASEWDLLGGAILVFYSDQITISNNTFKQNYLPDDDSYGGALAVQQTPSGLISNNTFVGNEADYGGALELLMSDNISVINNTFVNNVARSTGHVIDIDNVLLVTFDDNILYGGNGAACSDEPFTGSNNLISADLDTTVCGGASRFLPAPITSSHLGTLSDNGGLTETIPLIHTADNPAINASISGTTHDQRGFLASGIRDIGAYELQLPTVEFDTISSTVQETDGALSTILRVTIGTNEADSGSFTLNLTPSGTATVVDDYTVNFTNPITVNYDCAGSPSCTVTVPNILTLIADGIADHNETIILTMASPAHALLGTNDVHTITIEDEVTATISASTATISEDGGTAQFQIALDKTNATGSNITINYTVSGTAVEGTDFDATPALTTGSVVIPAGDDSASIAILGIDNDVVDGDRTLVITLTNSAGIVIGTPSSATITILDDDVPATATATETATATATETATATATETATATATETATATPEPTETVTSDYPIVVDVLDVNGVSIDGVIYNVTVEQLTIQFNIDVFDDGDGTDQDSASNPANYILLTEGSVDGFQTESCVGGVSDDDEQIVFASVSYDSASFITTLTFDPVLEDGIYQLIVCGTTSIVSADDVTLHLNNGADVVVGFTIDTTVEPTATPEPTETVEPTVIPTVTPEPSVTAEPTVIVTATAVPSDPWTPAPATPAQPEDLGVIELPATGERPLWADLLGRVLGK